MNRPQLYLIPGMGADARLFSEIRKQGLDHQVIEFIPPKHQESLADYGRRMAAHVDTSKPHSIGGVSLGGMVAMEVAKHTQPHKIYLISSVKNQREFPFYFQLGRFLPIHRLFTQGMIRRMAPRNPFPMAGSHREILNAMREDMDPSFIKWALNATVHWRNQEVPRNLIHIHGTRDLMFPPPLIGDHIKVKKGSHVMVLDQAAQIVDIIRHHQSNSI